MIHSMEVGPARRLERIAGIATLTMVVSIRVMNPPSIATDAAIQRSRWERAVQSPSVPLTTQAPQ